MLLETCMYQSTFILDFILNTDVLSEYRGKNAHSGI